MSASRTPSAIRLADLVRERLGEWLRASQRLGGGDLDRNVEMIRQRVADRVRERVYDLARERVGEAVRRSIVQRLGERVVGYDGHAPPQPS